MTSNLLQSYGLVMSAIFLIVFGQENWKDQDQSKWVDPNDMINYNPVTQTNRRVDENPKTTGDPAKTDQNACDAELAKCRQTESNLAVCNKSFTEEKVAHTVCINRTMKCDTLREEPFFKHYIRMQLCNFDAYAELESEERGRYVTEILITSLNYKYLLDYCDSDIGSVQEVHNILTNMMHDVRWLPHDTRPGFDWEKVREYLDVAWKMVAVMLCSVYTVLLFYRTPIRSIKWFAVTFCIVAFVCSVPWTWWHLYKKKLAANRATIMKEGISESCLRQDEGVLSVIYSVVFGRDRACIEYYQKLEIDPVWEVTPAEAVVATLTQLIIEPAGHVGEAIRVLITRSFEGLPLHLYIPVFIVIIVLLILGILVGSGYGVRTVFFSIGPNPNRNQAAMDRLRLKELEVDQMKIELLDLRRTNTELNQTTLVDQMRIKELEVSSMRKEMLYGRQESCQLQVTNQRLEYEATPLIFSEPLSVRGIFEQSESSSSTCINDNNRGLPPKNLPVSNNTLATVNKVSNLPETSVVRPVLNEMEKSITNLPEVLAPSQILENQEVQYSIEPTASCMNGEIDQTELKHPCVGNQDGSGDAKILSHDICRVENKFNEMTINSTIVQEDISNDTVTTDATNLQVSDDVQNVTDVGSDFVLVLSAENDCDSQIK